MFMNSADIEIDYFTISNVPASGFIFSSVSFVFQFWDPIQLSQIGEY